MKTRVEGTLYGEAVWLEWEDGRVRGSDLAVADLHDLKPPVWGGSSRYTGIEIGPIDLTKHVHFAVCAHAVLGRDLNFEGDIPPMRPSEVVG